MGHFWLFLVEERGDSTNNRAEKERCALPCCGAE
jgi:hypothetical protein